MVEANVHDIGTGVQTVLSQIAAGELGLSPDQVEVRWGDTDLPRTGPTYGSSTTVGTGSAVAAAARDVTKQLAGLGLGRAGRSVPWSARATPPAAVLMTPC